MWERVKKQKKKSSLSRHIFRWIIFKFSVCTMKKCLSGVSHTLFHLHLAHAVIETLNLNYTFHQFMLVCVRARVCVFVQALVDIITSDEASEKTDRRRSGQTHQRWRTLTLSAWESRSSQSLRSSSLLQELQSDGGMKRLIFCELAW